MEIKKLVLDVDGTLTFADKTIDPAALEAIKKAKDAGIEVILASGIPVQGLRPLAALVGASQHYVGENGGAVFDGEKIELLASNEDAKKCFEELKKAHPEVSIFSEADIRFSEVCLKRNIAREKVEAVAVKYGLRVVDTSFAIHLMMPGVNKGAGLKMLSERLGFKLEECAAVGDSENDIEMITEVGFGAAVANAQQEVKDAADYVCKEERGKGVLEVVEKIIP